MGGILLRWTLDGGEVALSSTNRIATGDPLATKIFASLHTDRAPSPGDPVPEGVVRRGNWQRSFDPNALEGSRLWLLPYVRPVSRALVFAPLWADEAVQWLITRKRVLSITNTARRLGPEAIGIEHLVQIDAATRRRFLTEVPYAL